MDTLSFSPPKKSRPGRAWTLLAIAWCTFGCEAGRAQTPAPPVLLQIETEHDVVYFDNVSDYAMLASNPNRTTITGAPRSFTLGTIIGDITAVNGGPATGIFNGRWNFLLPTGPAPVASAVRAGMQDGVLEILQADGTPVGSIAFTGFLGDSPTEPTLATTQCALTIIGGTGAFLGVRGQGNSVTGERFASASEDPAYRSANPVGVRGGKGRFVFQLVPMSRPEVVITADGPAVFHGSDFSPVTALKPARVGEILIVTATNLGQTRPGIEPGRPFPEAPLQAVNAPLAVTINEQPAAVINAVGWPGQDNRYRVDVRVPDGTAAGSAAIRLILAWTPGPEVRIAIR